MNLAPKFIVMRQIGGKYQPVSEAQAEYDTFDLAASQAEALLAREVNGRFGIFSLKRVVSPRIVAASDDVVEPQLRVVGR